MPRSMTGFGVADGPVAGGRMQCELRTVNHKHLNIQLRVPPALQSLEEAIRDAVRARLSRGHAALHLRWLEEPARPASVRLDLERARAVADALGRLRAELGLSGEPDLLAVARFPEVLTTAPAAAADEIPAAPVLEIVAATVASVIAMRDREGAALVSELSAQLDVMAAALEQVAALAPERLTRERDRLRAAVAELLDDRAVNDDRLAQELAFLAEKLDLREEIVRLKTHLGAARAALGHDGPVGRQLGFLAQEMLREINTIGSKANDAAIAQLVIGMKGELERFREQLENLE